MNKVIILAAILLLFIVGTVYLTYQPTAGPAAGPVYAADYRDGTYGIFGEQIALQGGLSEIKVDTDTAATVTTRYFGNEARGDLNGDGVEDIAFLMTQNAGGSGTFYLVAVALGSEKGYLGTNTILLGDRIAPQSTEIRDGQIIVNFAVRNEGEPMTSAPSIGVSARLQVISGQLVAVE